MTASEPGPAPGAEPDFGPDPGPDPGPEPQPEPGPEPGPAPRMPAVRVVVFVLVVLVAGVLGQRLVTADLPPTLDELRAHAGWSGVATLAVGVNGDIPGISERQPDGSYRGFDVDIARAVARWLGVPDAGVRFYDVTPENRHRMVGSPAGRPGFTELDLVVAAYSITPERQQREGIVFAGPYLSTWTSVLVRAGHAPVRDLRDLDQPVEQADPSTSHRGQQVVCAPGTSTSAGYLGGTVTRARVIRVQRNSECDAGLRSGTYDAAVTDAALLAGFAARSKGTLRLDELTGGTREAWGVAVGTDPTGRDPRIQARARLVALALDEVRRTVGRSDWQRAFATDLQPSRTALAAVRPAGSAPVADSVAVPEQPVPQPVPVVRRPPGDGPPGDRAGEGAS